jgi:anthranilate synthase component 2
MILIIDNYDSFTYNLVQLIGQYTREITVLRNDKVTVEQISQMRPSHIVLSPGPGRPEDAGICIEVIQKLGTRIPLLGVCLGHQAIGQAFGGKVIHAPSLMHGKTSSIHHNSTGLFSNVPLPFSAARYHSLVIEKETMPKELEVTATTDDGIIMGVRHQHYPIEGIQFHPESVLTEAGPHIISNWLRT